MRKELREAFRAYVLKCNGAEYSQFIGSLLEADVISFIEESLQSNVRVTDGLLKQAFEAGESFSNECFCGECGYCNDVKDISSPSFTEWRDKLQPKAESLNTSALNWYYGLTPEQQEHKENIAFGEPIPNECRRINIIDILHLYKWHNREPKAETPKECTLEVLQAMYHLCDIETEIIGDSKNGYKAQIGKPFEDVIKGLNFEESETPKECIIPSVDKMGVCFKCGNHLDEHLTETPKEQAERFKEGLRCKHCGTFSGHDCNKCNKEEKPQPKSYYSH